MSSAHALPSGAKVRIRPATEEDLPAIQEIYAHYVLTSTSSFEEEAPTVAEMTARWQKLEVQRMPYFVAMVGKRIAGYAYGGPFRERSAYRYTIEDSIYIAPDMMGRGIGNALMSALIDRCIALGYRQMIAVIGDSANAASIALHSRHGFAVIGALRSSGYKFGKWSDAVLMQRALGEGDSTLPEREVGRRRRKRKRVK
ncbi:MAG: GNAT family N-acetyltransferase [Rhodospirillaceae bacterium]|nr:GNAT family N-acetyltransferase [Rhodospirillaceae bacterium]